MSSDSSTTPAISPTRAVQPDVVTGVQLMKGIGVRQAKGFWADAWSTVFKRRTAVVAVTYLLIVAFFSVFAPLLASGHPLWMRWTDAAGKVQTSSPLWQNLTSLDLILLAATLIGVPYVLGAGKGKRVRRFWTVMAGAVFAIAVLAIAGVVQGRLQAAATEAARAALRAGDEVMSSTPLVRRAYGGFVIGGTIAVVLTGLALAVPGAGRVRMRRLAVCAVAGVISVWAVGARFNQPLQRFDYTEREIRGEITATYTLVPWSPNQRFSSLQRQAPLTVFGEVTNAKPTDPPYERTFILGTDAFGVDVLSQILHACRLSISIGVVSSLIALMIGVTMGSLMGYFGGWVDLFLFRVVEIFMAVPVLFLLIVAVAVLPDELKTTYVIMAIIGCFTWTGMARFTRAEFMKLRNQDFVQAAQAAGLPLRSILFRHMLPNGVAPVLVDTSFAIAAAISIEAVLSYLGLGPVDSPSWGKLLSSAISQEGEFKWWLAVFPGLAIFLTVLAYNLLGESLRDAIDPKLKKARV